MIGATSCELSHRVEVFKASVKDKTIYGHRCDERLKTNVEESTRLACTPKLGSG